MMAWPVAIHGPATHHHERIAPFDGARTYVLWNPLPQAILTGL
jgi:hypothetical protein